MTRQTTRATRHAIAMLASMLALTACQSATAPTAACNAFVDYCNGVRFSAFHPDTSRVQYHNPHGGSFVDTISLRGWTFDQVEVVTLSRNGFVSVGGYLSKIVAPGQKEIGFLPFAAVDTQAGDAITVRVVLASTRTILASFTIPVLVSRQAQ